MAQFQRVAATVFATLLAFLVLMGHGPAWGWLARVRAVSVLRSYGLAGWREIATLAGMRAAYFSVFALYFWAGSTAFHVDLPLAVSTATVALILLAQFIPLTPGGLGTTQAAMLYLWEPYGPEAGILAFALAFPVCITVSRVLLGLLYVRDIRGRLRKGR